MNGRILLTYTCDRLNIRCNTILRSTKHLNQRINVNPVRSNSVLFRFRHDLVKNFQTICCTFRNSCIITKQCNYLPAFISRLRHNRENRINLMSLSGYRVKNSRFLTEFICLCQNIRTWTVDRNRKICNLLNTIDHPFQGFHFLCLRNRSTTVNICSSTIRLKFCSRFDKLCVPFRDCFCY